MTQEFLQIKVDGIPQNENLISLERMFSKYGAIVDLNRGQNCVYVQYRTAEQAKKALQAFDGNPMYGILKKLKACYVISKKPDCIVFYNVNEEDIQKLTLILKKSKHFINLLPLRTEMGFVPLAIAYFNQNNAMKSTFTDLKKSGNVRKQIFFEILPHVPQDADSMVKIAEEYEKRTLFITGFYKKFPTEKSLLDHFERFGIINVLEIGKKYEIIYAVILLDTAEKAKLCIKERNYSFLDYNPMPLSIRPFLLRNIPHPTAGLLTLNEFDTTLSWYDLYTQFEEYGDIYDLTISNNGIGGKSLMVFILYRDLSSANKAKDSCNLPNVFVFPPFEDAVKAIKFFIPQAKSPNTTLITQQPGSIRSQLSLNENKQHIAYTFSILNSSKNRRTIVITYTSVPYMLHAIEEYKAKGIPFYISYSYIFPYIYNWYNSIAIPESLVKKIYYAKNIGSDKSNKYIRECFEKVAPVDLAVNLSFIKKVLVIFKDVVDKNDPKFLKIFPNPILLEDVLNVFRAVRSFSTGELNAQFQPNQTLLDEIQKRDPSKIPIAEDRIRRMGSNEAIITATDPEKMAKFVEEVTGIPQKINSIPLTP